jgi:hypothetical protein
MESSQLNSGPRCPFCDGAQPELVGQWGAQMITAQWRCGACGSYFEAIRESLHDRDAGAPGHAGPAAASIPEK